MTSTDHMAAAVTSESSQGNTESILIATSDFQAADDNQVRSNGGKVTTPIRNRKRTSSFHSQLV